MTSLKGQPNVFTGKKRRQINAFLHRSTCHGTHHAWTNIFVNSHFFNFIKMDVRFS